jgi:hypothetical protein
MIEGIYRFYWDCGRIGDVSSIFLSNDDSIAWLIGRECYFGEILGKHSNIHGTINEDDIELVTEDPVAVDIFRKYGMANGYDPFDYVTSDKEDVPEMEGPFIDVDKMNERGGNNE